MSGPSQPQVEARQKAEVGDPLNFATKTGKAVARREALRLGTDALVKRATQKALSGAAASTRLAALGGLGSILFPIVAAGEAAYRTTAEGHEQQRAYARDSQNLAVNRFAYEALDPEYVSTYEAKRTASVHGADKLMTELLTKQPAKFQELKQQATAYAKDGVAFVKTSGGSTRTEVMEQLAKDPVASRNYDNNTAFRAGVDSEIFAMERAAKKVPTT